MHRERSNPINTEINAEFIDGPISRITTIADILSQQAQELPIFLPGDRVMVLVHGIDEEGAIGIAGYGDPSEMETDLLVFVKAFLEAGGRSVSIVRKDARRPNAV
jgi:hypothetical protein